MSKRNTIKVYDGPSLLDGVRIIVLLTGLARKSKNPKTGDMLQTWIMRYDTDPQEAVDNGKDASVCGNCPLRPIHYKAKNMPKPCYVHTWQAPKATWNANKDLEVTDSETVVQLVSGRKVRRGAYGDPTAVPQGVWSMLDNGETSTGYTHQWKQEKRLQGMVMASVHTPEERLEAKALGFRTFRVMDTLELQPGEVLCPASKEAGERTSCEKCGLCNGSKENDKRKDVAIVAH